MLSSEPERGPEERGGGMCQRGRGNSDCSRKEFSEARPENDKRMPEYAEFAGPGYVCTARNARTRVAGIRRGVVVTCTAYHVLPPMVILEGWLVVLKQRSKKGMTK